MKDLICSFLGIGYYSSTSIKDLTKKELKEIVGLTLDYCESELGVNRRKSCTPNVVLDTNPYETVYYGEYCPNENVISIFLDEMSGLGQITSTIIHEYTHYLQPIATKYYKLLKEHGYDNHPHEIEARDNERIHNRRVLHYIRTKMWPYDVILIYFGFGDCWCVLPSICHDYGILYSPSYWRDPIP